MNGNSSPAALTPLAAPSYTPGFTACKQMMVVVGLALAIFGISQLWLPLRLSLFGKHAIGEAVRVIKTKPGLPDVILRTAAETDAQLEPRDRSYVFWNEFSFHTGDGQTVEVRANVGHHVGPLYPLFDADGLPTTDLVYYDPAVPTRAIFPLIISTWLAAAVLTLGGLVCSVLGAVLLYWANKPIEIPHIPTAEEVEALHAGGATAK